MELKTGYKQTEVGVIPSDWEVKELREVAQFASGTTPRRELHERYFINGNIFWVKTMDLNNADILDTSEKVTEVAMRETSSLKIFPVNTVLIAMYGGFNQIGRTGILKISACVNQAITAIKPDNNCLSPQFLIGFLNYRVDYWKDVATSSRKDPNITSKDVKNFKITIPTLTEQTAIATALSDTDQYITHLEKLIAKKRNIKQGAMQELLKPKEGWVVKKLGDVGKFSKGQGIRKDDAQSGEIPCVRYGELYTRHNDYVKSFHSYISKEICLTAKQLKFGDILFAGSGETKEEIGKCAAFINDFEAFAGGDIVILSPVNQSSLFLGFLLNTPSVQNQKASRGQGDAVVHISASQLEKIEVALPSLETQNQIATILSDMDSEITTLETKLSKAKSIKQGMMQQLLTGKIRLV